MLPIYFLHCEERSPPKGTTNMKYYQLMNANPTSATDNLLVGRLYHHPSGIVLPTWIHMQGRIQDFKLGGALKKIAPSGGRRGHFWGISCEKITILRQKILFFPILGGGGGRRVRLPPWIRPCICIDCKLVHNITGIFHP